MSEDEKAAIVEALQDQSETPAADRETKPDAIIDTKPEVKETPEVEEEEEGLSLKSKRFGIGKKKAATKPADTSTEATNDAIAPSDPNSLKNRLEELKKNCGGKK